MRSRGAEAIPDGMAPRGARQPGSVDLLKTGMYLWRQWQNQQVASGNCSRGVPKFLALVRRRGSGQISVHPAVQSTACLALLLRAQPDRTAVVREPYARRCGRGGAVTRPPYPDL
jgi:hypothetical protein